MSLTYDAAGRKWRKQVTGVIKDYCQGIEYKDGKVEAVYGQEGRLTAVYDQYGVTLTRFRAEYWLKDHLGNTRLAFADDNHNGTIEVWDDPSTPENEAEITQENHYYPFGMNHEGPWYATIGPRNGYQYNGKELNEELELDWNDYGARWQDPATGRWWHVDPLAEERRWVSPYSYVQNNPILRVDPEGVLDSPIFDKDGNFLGVDSEGYSGTIIIMDRTAFNTVSRINGDQPLNHDQVMIWVEKSPLAAKLNDAGLDAEGYSKVYTHIVKQMEGEKIEGKILSFEKLEGGIINTIDFPIDDDGVMGHSYGKFYGNPSRIPFSAEAATLTRENGDINVTTALLGGKGQFETVEHVQSVLGIHEYYGHGLQNVPQTFPAHSRAYKYQFNHKLTFDKLSPHQKAVINENKD